jgi:hypothetical protein
MVLWKLLAASSSAVVLLAGCSSGSTAVGSRPASTSAPSGSTATQAPTAVSSGEDATGVFVGDVASRAVMLTVVENGDTLTGTWTSAAPVGALNQVSPATSVPFTGLLKGGLVTITAGRESFAGSWNGSAFTLQLPASPLESSPGTLLSMLLTRGTAEDFNKETALLGDLNYALKNNSGSDTEIEVGLGRSILDFRFSAGGAAGVLEPLMDSVPQVGQWVIAANAATDEPVQILDDAGGDSVIVYGAIAPGPVTDYLAKLSLREDPTALRKEITLTNSETMVFSSCKAAYKPTSIDLCGDGTLQLQQVVYRSWTSDSAEGTATQSVNNCVPTCAAGKFEKSQVSFSLDKPTVIHGLRLFTRLLIHTPGELDESYDLPTQPN